MWPLWPVLLGLGALVYRMSKSGLPITLDAVLNALWKRPSPNAKGMRRARQVYKTPPDHCLANQHACVCYWRKDYGAQGIWESVDIGVWGYSGSLVIHFKDGSIHSWTQHARKREVFDIEETLVSGEVLRRVRHAIERAGS